MFKYTNREPLEMANHSKYIEKLNNNEYEYLVCFEETKTYKYLNNKYNLKFNELIYESGSSKIYKVKE